MDKKSKEIIKEVIDDILKLRKKKLKLDINDDSSFFYPNEKSQNEKKERIEYRQQRTIYEYDIPLVKLNNLLKIEDRYQEVLEIEKEMTRLQAKKYITVKEFTEIYGKSADWQRNRRGRIRNRLPFMQEKLGSGIMYKVEDLEVWFQNNT